MKDTENIRKEIKNERLVEALRYITDTIPDVIIGGSISFIARNLLTRDPNDIDIMVPMRGPSFSKSGIFELISEDVGSDTVTDINGELIRRTSLKVKGVKVCVFELPAETLIAERLVYKGVVINCQIPAFGIVAKKVYSARNLKHSFDLAEIEKNMFQIVK